MITTILKPNHNNNTKTTFDLSLQVHPIPKTFNSTNNNLSTTFTIPLKIPIINALNRYNQNVTIINNINKNNLTNLLINTQKITINTSKTQTNTIYIHTKTSQNNFKNKPIITFQNIPIILTNTHFNNTITTTKNFHNNNNQPNITLLTQNNDRIKNPEKFIIPKTYNSYLKKTNTIFIFSKTTKPSLSSLPKTNYSPINTI